MRVRNVIQFGAIQENTSHHIRLKATHSSAERGRIEWLGKKEKEGVCEEIYVER